MKTVGAETVGNTPVMAQGAAATKMWSVSRVYSVGVDDQGAFRTREAMNCWVMHFDKQVPVVVTELEHTDRSTPGVSLKMLTDDEETWSAAGLGTNSGGPPCGSKAS
jgi:hypothetical protein